MATFYRGKRIHVTKANQKLQRVVLAKKNRYIRYKDPISVRWSVR